MMGKRVARSRYRRRKLRYPWVVGLIVVVCVVSATAWFALTHSDTQDEAPPSQKSDSEAAGDSTIADSEQEPEDPPNTGVMPEIDENGEVRQNNPDPPEGSTTEGQDNAADDPYIYGTPVAEGEAVDDSWFEDAVFLGDSRTEGLQLYSGITSGTFFWEWGMSVFKIDDTNHRKVVVDGEKMTLMEALATGTWEKVYIMIGINDLGYQASAYQKALGEMIDRVREIQSGAVIYLQTMPPVNESLANENGISYYINNENVNAFNEAIVQVAREKQVVLLDTASCLTDSEGQLPADMSSDGVHFKKSGYQTWLNYLKCHTLSSEVSTQSVTA